MKPVHGSYFFRIWSGGGGGGGGQMTIRGGGMCIVRINVDSICGV